MKTIGYLIAVGAMMFGVSAQAYFDAGQHNSSRDVVTKRYKTKTIATPEYSPTHILCIKKRRHGSLVTQKRCQTIAEWKQELNGKAMRQYMIQASGKKRGWELDHQ